MKSDSSSFFKTILRNIMGFMLIIGFSVPLVNYFDKKLTISKEVASQEIMFYSYNDINKIATIKNSYNIEQVAQENDCKVAIKEETNENKYEQLILTYNNKIEFYSKTFKVDYEIIVNDLKTRSANYEEYNENNLGFVSNDGVLNNYANVDLGLIAYFEEFLSIHPELNNKTITPYTGSAEYIEALIGYFTAVYGNVDYNTAVSIGAAETGAYLTKGARAVNNIYGGLANGKLIPYKNIEYGVLTYIKLLSTKYYGQGLDTIEKIGYVYCPVVNENGVKTASSHWLNLVYTYKSKYGENIYQDLNYVLSLNV